MSYHVHMPALGILAVQVSHNIQPQITIKTSHPLPHHDHKKQIPTHTSTYHAVPIAHIPQPSSLQFYTIEEIKKMSKV
eukprot:CAMPEP_0168566392 /NCGR_PEP_ID=MMETSP0413-20121227/14396_1 /TAXON_ID=136452 /ORGANISM="Filamoeba nolandi, Strain NC-AS-23-1" /LENGTH=77 /DNA_ID=CAMNT_0008598411 /DNA_START=105 /DNA_END=338 /DNA_ORIENTATION=+